MHPFATLTILTYYLCLLALVGWSLHRLWLALVVVRADRLGRRASGGDSPAVGAGVGPLSTAGGALPGCVLSGCALSGSALSGSALSGIEAPPRVTVQLPLYNEPLVAERLIRAVAALDYPRDRLRVQVLDDSTDATAQVVDRVVAELAASGVPIAVVRRARRIGYKAGALEHGLRETGLRETGLGETGLLETGLGEDGLLETGLLETGLGETGLGAGCTRSGGDPVLARAGGELIAVFDADFVPPSDFLLRLVPEFADPTVGFVQARWGHLNRDSNLLTRAQALLLDGHFLVEQPGRHAARLPFNFNGTAGIWRRQTIVDAGGWQHDTITEDLDLSYRAQLVGWRGVYRDDVVAPAELPADLLAFRGQQHRWAKGSAETLRKLGHRVLRSRLPLRARLHALVHLSANLAYVALLLVATLMGPVALLRQRHELGWMTVLLDLPLFIVGLASVVTFFGVAERRQGRPLRPLATALPFALALDIGISLHKSRAVIEALIGHRTAFVRTPKHALIVDERHLPEAPERAPRLGAASAATPAILLESQGTNGTPASLRFPGTLGGSGTFAGSGTLGGSGAFGASGGLGAPATNGTTAVSRGASGASIVAALSAGSAELVMAGALLLAVSAVLRGPAPSLMPLPFLLLFFLGYGFVGLHGVALAWPGRGLPAGVGRSGEGGAGVEREGRAAARARGA